MPSLREPVNLGLDEPLFFIFIINLAIVIVCVSEHITAITVGRTSISESNGLIPVVVHSGGFRVDSFAELGD